MSKLRNWAIRKTAELQARKEEGQGLVEYALIIALVSIALVAGLTALQGGIDGVFTDIIAAF